MSELTFGPWIEWDGSGQTPVLDETVVEVMFRHKRTVSRRPKEAWNYKWQWGQPVGSNGGDIIAYRVAPSP